MQSAAEWREDIDALQFAAGERRACMLHRLAFRRLLGRDPRRDDCMAYFAAHDGVFRAAAALKIARHAIARGRNFHLTSRDIARQGAAARNLQAKLETGRGVSGR
jgi:hypothetical protein